jgi:hypothetical protein
LGPVPIQRPSGLRFAPDRGSTLLGALVVGVLKSGIYDIWAAVEAPYSLAVKWPPRAACSSFTPLSRAGMFRRNAVGFSAAEQRILI